jgi:hypothetical protein
MTSHPQIASMAVPRRPAPPRSAASVHAFASPVTYTPEEYDPRHAPAPIAVGAGGFGLVLPKPRTGRAGKIALLLIVAAVGGFLGWRVAQSSPAAEPGVAYTSAAGHFSARFPAQPVEISRSEHQGRTRLIVHMAVAAGQGSVGEFELAGPSVAKVGKLADRLAESVGAHGITLSSVQHFTFRGMPATQGNYIQSNTGELATALMAVESQHRFYIVLGLTGPTFDQLKASFAVVH